MDQKLIKSVISAFNKKSKEKASLVEAVIDSVTIEFSGIDVTGDAQQYFESFRQMLEEKIEMPLIIEKIKKEDDFHIVKFCKNHSPAEDIMKTLRKYYDGTTPYGTEGHED